MPLAAGTRLGPYEVIDLLGAGGMGEVYRARDTRLDRTVALKVSAERFSERFEREARVISSLNHPHICTLYDVGPDYLVMELIEGETLDERIAHGPIPIAEALPITRHIAEALEYAHDKNVIHRDLKPANVKLARDGEVKVLDFGLAKVTEASAQTTSDPAASPTMTMQSTRIGMILGTAAYMPPEQARGQVVDRRADVWAFGCVLFEMLTGRRAFEGESTTDVLAAVVRAEPDWKALPADTPASIRKLLKRCLEKDRKRRLPDVGVARLEIDDALTAPEQLPVTQKRRSLLPWLVAAMALCVAAGAFWKAAQQPVQEVWTGVILGGPSKAYSPRLSPDGQLLAFLAFIDQLPQLGVMKPNGGSWTMLTRDREHGYITTVAWASDGSRIYFDRMWGHPLGIYSVLPLGGEPRLILDDAFGPEPLPDGSLIVVKLTEQGDEQIYRFWPDSGKLDALPAFIPQTDLTPMLRAFPDGKELVFYGTSDQTGRSQTPRMYVFDLASRHVRELSPGYHFDPGNTWSPLDVTPDGESVYLVSNEGDTRLLTKVPRKSGKPRAVLSFPSTASPLTVDAAPDGSLYTDQMLQQSAVLRFDSSGRSREEFASPGNWRSVVASGGDVLTTLSRSGKQRLMATSPGGEPHALVETTEETGTPATTFGGKLAFVIGSGDQRRIAIASLQNGRVLQRFSMRSDTGMSVSPDGKTLYYSYGGAIWAQPVSGDAPKRIGEGDDVVVDPAGQHLWVRRSRKGTLHLFRVPVEGGAGAEFPVPPEYHIALPALSPAAVDAHGRILISIASPQSFYYHSAILDPVAQSFTVVPAPVDGDTLSPGWTPDGRIVGVGIRYTFTLWRYRQSKSVQ